MPIKDKSLVEKPVSPYIKRHPHPLHSKFWFLVAQISMEILSRKVLQQYHNILSCPLGKNHPGEDETQCFNNCMISMEGNKRIICYQI